MFIVKQSVTFSTIIMPVKYSVESCLLILVVKLASHANRYCVETSLYIFLYMWIVHLNESRYLLTEFKSLRSLW